MTDLTDTSEARVVSPAARAEAGVSLIELLVTCLVLLLILAAAQRFLVAGFTTHIFGQDTYEAQAKVELAHKYLDRGLREARSVVAADPKGTYLAVITDADNDGSDELLEYHVDYSDGKLKEYIDETPYSPETSYNFANPSSDPSLQMTEIIANIQGTMPTSAQTATLSPNPADSGRPFIFIGDNPRLSVAYDSGLAKWVSPVKGIRTYFYVDVSPTSGAQAYALQTYIRFRNVQ